MTYINTSDFDGEYLTWATNGFAGYIKIISGKFSINADRGLLKPKQEGINIHYVRHRLEPILRGLARGRKGEKGEAEFTKVHPSMIEDIEIQIPIDEHGKFDIQTQTEIVEKINSIEEVNSKVNGFKKIINDLTIDITDQEI